MNLVGCMIGFYVYPASVEPSKDVIINKEGTKFVPWNEISEELILDGLNCHHIDHLLVCHLLVFQKL